MSSYFLNQQLDSLHELAKKKDVNYASLNSNHIFEADYYWRRNFCRSFSDHFLIIKVSFARKCVVQSILLLREWETWIKGNSGRLLDQKAIDNCPGSRWTNFNGSDRRDPCKSQLNTAFSIRLWPITLLKISRFFDGSHDHRSTTRKLEFPVEDLKFHARRACQESCKIISLLYCLCNLNFLQNAQ